MLLIFGMIALAILFRSKWLRSLIGLSFCLFVFELAVHWPDGAFAGSSPQAADSGFLHWLGNAGAGNLVAIAIVIAVVIGGPLRLLVAQRAEDRQRAAAARMPPAPAATGPAPNIAPAETHVPLRGHAVILHYRDAHGAVTDRVVDPFRLDDTPSHDGAEHAAILHAYCHQAKAARSFRMDRIVFAADPTTGEIIPDLQDWLTH